ncbi:glycosyltransferase family 4 protein [Methanococcoides methylutens]|uniref:glycosyltransferase family 4 protein n=1 Tax=Methanococcoides methylutens TaxID=2226 RepID=UPI00069360A1|nr:glycosyltransferase family 4 protein [Methanococcoides methylutens]
MKILISVQHFDPPGGGAELSLMSIAKKLAEKHEIYVLQSGKNNEIKYSDEIKIIVNKVPVYDKHCLFPIILQAKYWKKILDEKINDIKPDLILTQLNFAPPTIDIAVKYKIPSIFFIRSYEHFCPIAFINGTNCNRQCQNCIPLQNKLRFLNLDKWLEWNIDAIRHSNLVIANSKFVANVTKEWSGIEPFVMYPSIDMSKYESDKQSKKYITMIKPTKIKGLDIFLKIAKSIPEKEFLAVGAGKRLLCTKTINNIHNVNSLGWTKNMDEVYSNTRILLAPVIWPEPFGRTIIEAGINGIPSIASNLGGLPEAVGEGGILIDDVYDIDQWVEAIYSLDDSSVYDELSKKAELHAQKFGFDTNFNLFKNSVKESLNINL